MNKLDIIKMIEYTGLSYKNNQPINSKETLVFINDKDTDVQCFVRQQNDKLIIVFRGSDSKKDWITDFKFWKQTVPYDNFSSNIRVHSGFLNAYKSKNVRKKIHTFINNKIHKVYISGHSYGAALATLCAVDLEYNFGDLDYEVVLFGSPRVGNKAFSESYNKRVFKTLRIENCNDVITKIPFKFLGYNHVGARICVGSKKLFSLWSLSAHDIKKYYAAVLRLFLGNK